MTTQDEIWNVVRQVLQPGSITSLQDIYHAVKAKLQFTEADLRPEVAGSSQAAWQRNVRNVLQTRRRTGEVIWHGGARYSLPELERTDGGDWSYAEVQDIVKDYFDMLVKELHGAKYSKSDHRRKLLFSRVHNRSKGAIERKHQNISAVLLELSLPFIEGYKPLGNYQNLLHKEVINCLLETRRAREAMEQYAREVPELVPQPPHYTSPFVDPPKEGSIRAIRNTPQLTNVLPVVDFQKHEVQNRVLGEQGEKYVVQLEQKKLSEAGRKDLANKVEWVSKTRGDGLGYDIRSFEPSGEEIFIEVKTTNRGKLHPFPVTRNEVRRSEEMGRAYRVYRVFDFSKSPRIFVLQGSLKDNCELQPLTYEARI